jgi:exodeoxyribonuclease V alpha subunit
MVALYRPCGTIRDGTGNPVRQVKAVGYFLPVSAKLRYDIQGHWGKDRKHGVQFEVETYSEIIAPTKEGIIAYLSSGQIKGVGPKLAERIYEAYGDSALELLDKEPEKLISVPGISGYKLKKIVESYIANRGARDVVAFLVPHGITPNRAVRLFREYGNRTLEIVKRHPYTLCEMAGVGFLTADKIAQSMGFGRLSTDRADAALLYVLTDAETKGHLCLDKREFVEACAKLLQTPDLTGEMLANRAARLVNGGQIVSYNGKAYSAKAAAAEARLATLIARQLRHTQSLSYGDLEGELDNAESRMKLKLAREQREAIKTALTQSLTIITGGPGTGKTLILRAILDIYRGNRPENKICCCAPTGRAARRMNLATGCPASTAHKALGLSAGDDGAYNEPARLDADLILVDEVSMLDVYLAGHLFEAVKAGAQVVLIGDAGQLPPVGPGAVLSEMLASGYVPAVRLDKVFRQNVGSRIAANAKLISHGNLGLEYGSDFEFIDSPDIAESAGILADIYAREIAKYGMDNVALLSPYRQKTETGVNALNCLLQERVNPAATGKPDAEWGKKRFRLGDKVMQVKNHEDVSNGDIGYIQNIAHSGGDANIRVDFGDGRVKEYDASDLDMLDLAYASTVHKSQGCEYGSVIINLQCAHSVMLTRTLIYTAITRGRERVVIVGERRALCIAIKRQDTDKRGTCLAQRVQELLKKEMKE